MNFLWNVLILINIYALLCLGNNLTVGYAGLLNLAAAASFAIGSYAIALIMTRLGLGFGLAVVGAIMISVFMALILGLATLRYRRTSFALASLAFHVLVLAVIRNTPLFGGTLGIKAIPRPEWIGTGANALPRFWLLTAAFLAAVIVAYLGIRRSPWVLSLQAARDDELAALAVGKNVPWIRIESFLLSSGIIAMAGGLFACHLQYIDPTSFTIDESIVLLLALVCGGTCNMRGPLVGAVFVIALPEWLRLLDVSATSAANARNIVFGVLVILLVRYRPQGLAGRYALD
jgi:branched-chain amino acid transport system permease protein